MEEKERGVAGTDNLPPSLLFVFKLSETDPSLPKCPTRSCLQQYPVI